LQPLDRGIFDPFKIYLKNAHQNREVARMQLRIWIGGEWNRASSVANAGSAFKAVEILHLDQNAV
jgi:hypothetical protein